MQTNHYPAPICPAPICPATMHPAPLPERCAGAEWTVHLDGAYFADPASTLDAVGGTAARSAGSSTDRWSSGPYRTVLQLVTPAELPAPAAVAQPQVRA